MLTTTTTIAVFLYIPAAIYFQTPVRIYKRTICNRPSKFMTVSYKSRQSYGQKKNSRK